MNLEEAIGNVDSFDEFFALRKRCVGEHSGPKFEDLWRLSLQERWDGRRAVASFLLVSLNPDPVGPLEALLTQVSNSPWDLSNKIVPFYLVTHFGKHAVLRAIETLKPLADSADALTRMEGVAYWAAMPPAELVSSLNYFEWEEVIEGRATD